MVEILQKVAGAQGKEEPKFSLEKVLNLSYHIKWECYQSEIKNLAPQMYHWQTGHVDCKFNHESFHFFNLA